jgi:hypothetical protein
MTSCPMTSGVPSRRRAAHPRKTAIGGYQTTREDSGGRYIPRVALAEGEGKPLVLLGTLWPAAVAAALFVS